MPVLAVPSALSIAVPFVLAVPSVASSHAVVVGLALFSGGLECLWRNFLQKHFNKLYFAN